MTICADCGANKGAESMIDTDNMEQLAQNYLLAQHNFTQEEIFKRGGIALPKFKTYTDMEKFFKHCQKLFPPCNKRFSDLEKGGEITFDLLPEGD